MTHLEEQEQQEQQQRKETRAVLSMAEQSIEKHKQDYKTVQEVELACKKAAGMKSNGSWPVDSRNQNIIKGVQILMNHGEVLTIGWQNAARSMCMGVATLIGPAS